MQPQDFWKDYVGDIGPREFLGPEPPASIAELHAKVDQHVSRLPALYGLTLRKTWRKTWTGFGHNRDQVMDGIICYLESKSEDWEATPGTPLFSPRRNSEPASEPAAMPPETAAETAPLVQPVAAESPAAPTADAAVEAVQETPASAPESGPELQT